MIEMVLALPLIFVLALMLFYFGHAMKHLQRASVQDRYEAWRSVYGAPGPGASDPDRLGQIEEAFWDGEAQLSWVTGDRLHDDALQLVLDEAAAESQDAGGLADELLNNTLPNGRTRGFKTTVGWTVPSLGTAAEPIRHAHTRLDTEWKFVNGVRQRDDDAWIEGGRRITTRDAVANTFLSDLDDRLEPIAGGDWGAVAAVVRRYYRGQPGYRGPDVDYQFGN